MDASGGCARNFFLQPEDGIRDDLVTGVQTCALPICITTCEMTPGGTFVKNIVLPVINGATLQYQFGYEVNPGWGHLKTVVTPYGSTTTLKYLNKIGRASCRERV